ncbi:unnamed protein product [Echinostoma caproni]|uniref:Uncharacterized protein n=1 Tax=Echinostoma caproni TaxID=27848 RepID=A0A3P8IG77_9TREM|nr:unnamed protein product [Echinostoma caproni]
MSQKPYIQLNRKYILYFWFLIIISIFYGLPAVQLIMIYQKALVETGNEDLCYYNFECARPLGIFTAFNNIISNVGYVMLDTAYMYILAMLIMLKIYQTRHPDVNATAHSAYMVMAVVIFLGVTGVIYGSETFWIAFTIFFLLMSVVLTAEIYYMGHWNIVSDSRSDPIVVAPWKYNGIHALISSLLPTDPSNILGP